ncbi:MAG TPA: maleylpyruvate isomerase family mycothiol-dependent enzyme [Acidimicrobiales bacterium]|nr:maleylpyruvate isomerase family mycothiol-dependent enzyme [Acidimicrobiales bacterium]
MTAGSRERFVEASAYLLEVAAEVASDQWSLPALGEWSVRDLLGHASRALSTVTEYLGQPAERAELTAAGYLVAASGADRAAIAARGREAAVALGDDPVAQLRAVAAAAASAVAGADDDALVGTRAGGMRLDDYLPTRTVELVVHGLDLAAAIGSRATPPSGALGEVLHLLVDAACAQGRGVELCRALTGRSAAPVVVLA